MNYYGGRYEERRTKPFRVGGNQGERTEFWRLLAWHVGDTHASRLCWLIDLYCRIFRVRNRISYFLTTDLKSAYPKDMKP